MIVRPDFPDHYKTRMLVQLTNDPAAPIMILRLWAHCQVSRTSRFKNLSPDALKAICRADSLDASRLHEILVQAGFVDLQGDEVVVHEWEQFNAPLFRNWENGKKGGRPRKSAAVGGEGGSESVPPADKRTSNNPRDTLGLAKGNPEGTDKIRLDRIREEESEGKPSSPGGAGREGGGEGGSESVPPADKRSQLDEIVELFHTLCPTLPRVLKVEGQRRKAVRARWKAAGENPLEWFRSLFTLAGQSNRIASQSWCSFDWLMSPTNSQKVLEGNYANGRQTAQQQPRKFDKP